MNYIKIILLAAKKIGVASSLLLAICSHESNLKNITVPNDGKTPTHGICQIKLDTAKMLHYRGKEKGLMNPKTNALFAAKYLKYQLKRYDNDWCKATSAYNAGRYNESKVLPGYPRNLKYVRHVQKKLPRKLRHKLSCYYALSKAK